VFKREGRLHSGADIDHALNRCLSEETEKLQSEGAEAIPLEPTNGDTDSTEVQMSQIPTPSPAMTFFKSYAWSETNKPCLEIDRQTRGAYRELLELFAAVDAMQVKRRAREAAARGRIDPSTMLIEQSSQSDESNQTEGEKHLLQ
jgi:hypothetical protein